jgi:quercetin dioxygenase-like cupin family protein
LPEGFVALNGDEIKTGTIYGSPSQPGFYVTRNRFAPGSFSRPHFHDQTRYVTVIKGTWWVSLGPDADVFNPDKMVPMKAGSFVVHPAGGHHYDGAKDEEAIVQIMGMGPVRTTQIPQPGADPTGAGGRGRGRGRGGANAAAPADPATAR